MPLARRRATRRASRSSARAPHEDERFLDAAICRRESRGSSSPATCADDPAGAVDEERLGHAGHARTSRRLARPRRGRRVRDAVLALTKPARVAARSPACRRRRTTTPVARSCLSAAWRSGASSRHGHAPRRPEVDHDRPCRAARRGERAAARRGARGRTRAPPAVCPSSSAPTRRSRADLVRDLPDEQCEQAGDERRPRAPAPSSRTGAPSGRDDEDRRPDVDVVEQPLRIGTCMRMQPCETE